MNEDKELLGFAILIIMLLFVDMIMTIPISCVQKKCF